EIEIKDTEASALEILINFCYTGEIKISDVTVWSILPTACFLQLNEVQAFCCQFLRKKLSPLNCFGIRAFAEAHACQELFRSANEYILHNFEKLIGTEGFYHLHVEQLVELISSDELRVQSEEQVYAAVVEWIRFGLLDREQFLSKLLEHVRLPLCHPLFLVNTVSEDALVKADAVCRHLVDEAKNYQLLKRFPSKLPNMQGPRTKARKSIKFGGLLYVAGGNCNDEALTSVECLDPGEAIPMWRHVASMFWARDGAGVAAIDNFLYVIGGPPMLRKRYAFDVATLDDFIYAVGGSDGTQCLNIVERYDPRRNQWISGAHMLTCRAGLSVSVLNGCLYAVGGCDRSTLNTVE
ncbi:kelch repeat protein, partial [Ostertagia ostertagi]